MIRRKNIHQFIIVILLMSLATVACKKKKKEQIFPDDQTNNNTTTTPVGNNTIAALPTTTLDLPFSDDFNYTGVAKYGMPSNGKWLQAFVDGFKTDRGWGYGPTYGKNSTGCLGASAFGGTAGTDNAYLVTGPFDFSKYPTINLSFDIERFDGIPAKTGLTGSLKVKYSTNYSGSGNPEATGVTWTEITDITAKMPVEATDNVWKTIVSDLSSIKDSKVYLAFHWKDGDNSKSTTYDLDNVVLTNTALAQPCTPATSATAKTLPFSENFDFGTTINDYTIPCNYYEGVVNTFKSAWGYKHNFGKSSTGGVSAQSYGGATGTANGFFMLGSFNFTAAKTIGFDAAVPFTGSGTLTVKYSTNYTGVGDPMAAGVTWTDVTLTGLPPNTTVATTFAAVTGSIGAIGNAYVAIQYTGGTQAGSSTYNIDNVTIQ